MCPAVSAGLAVCGRSARDVRRTRRPTPGRGCRWLGAAVVDVGGGEQAEAPVVMLGVVPGEEALAERPRAPDRAEALGELGPILQGLELRFGERVVVGDVRPAVRLGDAQVGEQQRHRLRGHRGAAVGVQGELPGAMPCLRRLQRSASRPARRSRGGDHPAHDVAAEHVQDHVQVVVGPFRRAEQLGDVPGPDLVRPAGRQLGLDRGGVGGLRAPLRPSPASRSTR